MSERPRRPVRWLHLLGLALVLFLGLATGLFWDDLMRTTLDPKTPFQTYKPPPAPDYAADTAWAMRPSHPQQIDGDDPPADVFFISPTTFNGGKDWNGPIDDPTAERSFRRVMAPNYAGPFAEVGRLFAPRYRQASLYSLMTLREDARAARAFAYRDVEAAFRAFLQQTGPSERPLILVGVEQGAVLGERLLRDAIAPNPALRRRLAVAYLIETAVPADSPPIPPCVRKGEAGCLASWISVPNGQFQRAAIQLNRALTWDKAGELVNLEGRSVLCFNPILGQVSDAPAPARLNLGAANATGLEWGARPGFMARQVEAQCRGGVLYVGKPKSASLAVQGDWAERRKAPGFNLFYADLDADAKARVAALAQRR